MGFGILSPDYFFVTDPTIAEGKSLGGKK